jgi:hypothetical protein
LIQINYVGDRTLRLRNPHVTRLIVLFDGGGGYYGYRSYGGPGLDGVLGIILVILLVLWLVGALGGVHAPP